MVLLPVPPSTSFVFIWVEERHNQGISLVLPPKQLDIWGPHNPGQYVHFKFMRIFPTNQHWFLLTSFPTPLGGMIIFYTLLFLQTFTPAPAYPYSRWCTDFILHCENLFTEKTETIRLQLLHFSDTKPTHLLIWILFSFFLSSVWLQWSKCLSSYRGENNRYNKAEEVNNS